MNKKLNTLLVCLLVLATIVSWAQPSLAAKAINMPFVIYETVESEYLGPGIKYENIKKFTSKGWWNINVVRVDLNNEYAEIKGLMNTKGLSNVDTVSNLVNQSKAVAGVNGDFFNYNPLPHPIGAFIENGEIISSPGEKGNQKPTFYLDYNNNADITFIDRTMRLNSLDSGKSITIYYINKVSTKYHAATILNNHWGEKSIGNKYNKDSVEMVVENNIVKEIRIGQGPVNIPKNGFVVTTFGEGKDNIINNFKVGDKVQLNVTATPNIENIKFAIGGGSIILKNGIPTNTNININGNQPRTGIGISQDGKELIIATIDGRDISYIGVTQEVFSMILKDLGAYNAINLDGGGSTTMAVKPVDKQVAEVVNKPSGGTERRVPNGVGVFSNAPQGELTYIKVVPDEKNMFVNTSKKFTTKGYDQYYNPVEIKQDNVIYSVEGIDGEFSGNILKAKSEGKAIVTANYNGLEANTEIKVLGPVQSIILPIDKFNIKVNSKRSLGNYYGKDNNGFKAKIYPEDLDFSVTNDLGYVENNVFYSKDKLGAGAITVSHGNAINNILISIGEEGKPIKNFENLSEFKFSVYPNYVKGSLDLNKDSVIGNSSLQIKYDFSGGDGTRAAYADFKSGEKNGLVLNGNPLRLGLWVKGDGQGSWLRGIVKDKNGKEHYIDFAKSLDFTDWQYVEANIPDNIAYPITLERIYVVEVNNNKKHSGEILLDGLTGIYPKEYEKTGLPTPTSIKDYKNTKSEKAENGFSFIVTKVPNKLDEIETIDAKTIMENKINSHDVALFMGDIDTEFMKNLQPTLKMNTGINYYRKVHENVMFIDANNKHGGIRATNPEQWKWLKGGLENSTEDHIVLILPKPIFGNDGFKDPLEAELLHKLLVEAGETGKTVWVIHGGNSNKTEIRDGVRYIQYDNRAVENEENIKGIQAIEFIVNGEDISYQINPIFK